MTATAPTSENPLPARVLVRTGCRLHFGLLSVGRDSGRQFGGAGVMLESPGWEISFARESRDSIHAPADIRPRIVDTVRRLREFAPAQSGTRIEIHHEIPRHAGLGSGTQLGLALAQGWNVLHTGTPLPSIELAHQSSRGLRSAIGVHGFDQGGFLIEAGKLADEISPLVSREEFPADWRFVLVQPTDTSGLSGKSELQGFTRLEPMPELTTARLQKILDSQLLPAIRSRNFDACANALSEYGRLVGEYFAPVQGGIYASRQMEQLAARLREVGITGTGQTSWGPTMFVLCRDERTAKSLVERLPTMADGKDLRVTIAKPRNRGAEIAVPTILR